jgi:hypothetical protein
VRIREENDRAKGTHVLGTVEGETYQDTKRNRPSERCSLPGGDRGRVLSGHGKKPTERGALTSWGQKRERLVRIQKETDRARSTYKLETEERDLSGHRRKETEQGLLTLCRRQRE